MADTVLDDALADFDIPADRLQAASIADVSKVASAESSNKSAAASRSAAPVLNGASSAAHDSTSASKPLNALPDRKENSTAVEKSGSFDPLGKGNLKRKTKLRNPAASRKPDTATEASSSSSSRTQPPGKQPASQSTPTVSAKDNKEVDKELAQGMAQLMADLAKVWHLTASLSELACSCTHCIYSTAHRVAGRYILWAAVRDMCEHCQCMLDSSLQTRMAGIVGRLRRFLPPVSAI